MSVVLTQIRGPIAIATLNRPEALNALSTPLLDALADALEAWDADPAIRVMIVTGSDKAFAAGADVKEMAPKSFSQMHAENLFGRQMDRIIRVKKPVIAAVNGFALGGGCELAMALDIVIAGDTARFGQPEITLGIMPGLGGSQRTPLAMGKAKAMDLCLTGRMMDAAEALASGVVSRVVPAADLMTETRKMAEKIAAQSVPALMMVKEAINRAYEMPLSQGLGFERRAFHAMFATTDQKEGMAAFAEKRKPVFRDE